MDYKYEELEKKYATLPDDIRKAMSSMDIARFVENIGKSHSLHIDQIGQLMDEVSFIMLGFMHPSDFISNIQKSLEIDNEKAQEITKDINEKIFRPIKASLLSIHGAKQEKVVGNQKLVTERETPSKEQAVEEIEEKKESMEYRKLPATKIGKEKPLPEIAKKDIVEEKLGGEFNIPSTEKEAAEVESTKTSEEKEKPVDMYREPIE